MMVDLAAVASDLERDEAFVSHVYKDSKGLWTIGIGRMVDRKQSGGITKREAEYLLNNDILNSLKDLDRNIRWWRTLPEPWMRALVEMNFQMGWPRLSGFKKMIAALEAKNGSVAYDEALDSQWAREDSPERALRVASLYLKSEAGR